MSYRVGDSAEFMDLLAVECRLLPQCIMMTTRILVAALGGVLVSAALATSAQAGRVRVGGHGHYHARPGGHVAVMVYPRGLYFGAGLVGTSILDQSGGEELLEDGVGLALYGGWRLSPRLALELGWAGTLHNPVDVQTGYGTDVDYLVLNAFTGDAKIYLSDPNVRSRLEPYVQGGVGAYLLDSTYFGAQSVGSGFQLGGGLDYSVGPGVDLGLRGLYRGIAMGPPESREDDTFISAVSFEGNLTLRF